MKLKALKAALLGLVMAVSSFANAGLIYDIQNSKLMGVSGIELYGQVYNVQFGHSCETMYNGCDANMFTFTTSDDAVAALSALYSQALKDDVIVEGVEYDFDTKTNLIFSIEAGNFAGIWLPFAQDGQNATSAYGWHLQYDNDWFLAQPNAVYSTDWGLRNGYDDGYAVFTKWEKIDVPEPSTLAIFALGMIGLALRRFKKH